MIGMCPPRDSSFSLIRAVASKPSISGMWISISITSNGCFSSASTAAAPSLTVKYFESTFFKQTPCKRLIEQHCLRPAELGWNFFLCVPCSGSPAELHNKSGHFQTSLTSLAVEVKDQTRFPEMWAYFVFSVDAKTADAKPKQRCWQCHNDHAAVEHTFVQFYPTLKPIAQKFGTYPNEAETV